MGSELKELKANEALEICKIINLYLIEKGGRGHFEPDIWFFESNISMQMEVVEQITKEFTFNLHCFPTQGFDCIIKDGNFRRGYGEGDTPAIAIFNCLASFINWYNSERMK